MLPFVVSQQCWFKTLMSFGASPLHFDLQAFEALLHIAYNQHVKIFKVRNPEDKATVPEKQPLLKLSLSKNKDLLWIAKWKKDSATPTLEL
jgi:hypothetical protein